MVSSSNLTKGKFSVSGDAATKIQIVRSSKSPSSYPIHPQAASLPRMPHFGPLRRKEAFETPVLHYLDHPSWPKHVILPLRFPIQGSKRISKLSCKALSARPTHIDGGILRSRCRSRSYAAASTGACGRRRAGTSGTAPTFGSGCTGPCWAGLRRRWTRIRGAMPTRSTACTLSDRL